MANDSPRRRRGRERPPMGVRGSSSVIAGPDAPPPTPEPRRAMTTRIPQSTLKAAKLAALRVDMQLQDFVDVALREKIARDNLDD